MEMNKSVPMNLLYLVGRKNAMRNLVNNATPESELHMKAAAYDVLIAEIEAFLKRELDDE
jgi:hypothetical protein